MLYRKQKCFRKHEQSTKIWLKVWQEWNMMFTLRISLTRAGLRWPRRDITKYILHFHISAFSTFAFSHFRIFKFCISMFPHFHIFVFSCFSLYCFIFSYFHNFVFSCFPHILYCCNFHTIFLKKFLHCYSLYWHRLYII